MPPNTVYVGRPSKWENPFPIDENCDRAEAIRRFKVHLASYFGWVERATAMAFYPLPVKSTEFEEWIKPLRGKNLACWCRTDEECHADFLLKIANED